MRPGVGVAVAVHLAESPLRRRCAGRSRVDARVDRLRMVSVDYGDHLFGAPEARTKETMPVSQSAV